MTRYTGRDAQAYIAARNALAARLHNHAAPRTCRVCGCTDDTACIDDAGNACSWVQDDLCSSCQEG